MTVNDIDIMPNNSGVQPRKRLERIQRILDDKKIPGKVIRVRHVNLFLGPVKCVNCSGMIKSRESVWRVVVKKPPVMDMNVAKTEIRFLGVREYRLCLNCEPPPRIPLWMHKIEMARQRQKSKEEQS